MKIGLFSPQMMFLICTIYGKAFETAYIAYEKQAQEGTIALFKVIEANKLWRKMLSRLFETGHPWITFKDPSNIRSPQDHVGVVHSSNLCTEITLNTSASETAVCNLGSVNLGAHITNGICDDTSLSNTVTLAMRMLDNVIDINFYPTKEARDSNIKHRPVGLGQMGLQDALYKQNIAFDSKEAMIFADQISEKIAHYAIYSSSQLAKERGTYQTYTGSKWDRGIFPQDTIALLEKERGMSIDIPKHETLDWSALRTHVQTYGMRNSNCMAIAPTATIANISDCYPCIEPLYKNLYVKANMSGEFTVVNKYLVEDLKKLQLWGKGMLDQLKYYDGSLQMIESIPEWIKHKYKEAFELDPEVMIDISAARGRWLDQSQSHNVFMKGVSGKKLHDIYIKAWQKGLKTTYYLRTLGASQIEKSTLDAKKFGFTQKREYTATYKVTEGYAQEKHKEYSVTAIEYDNTLDGINKNITSKIDERVTMEYLTTAAGVDMTVSTCTTETIMTNSVGKIDLVNEEDDVIKNVKACSIENPECDVCQ
jgi:ribonucleoside-diphosphate reductase alpha chain